jgi:DNA-binding CsgD family transcriptional regulator/tetratricopeptide (TPR) repeat protein
VGEDGHGGFVGRDGELAAAGAALAAARAGQPRIVVVEGEPGIGKTALLHRCARMAPDAAVVWASGDPAESGLDGGLVRQLLAALPDQPEAGRDEAGQDGLSLGAALLAGIGALEEQCPLVILVVDDLHWADRTSAQALLFGLRRLRSDPVLVLLAARPGRLDRLGGSWARLLADGDRVRRLRLAGLSPAEVVTLASANRWDLTAESGARLAEHTAGNPLYLLALLTELPADAFAGGPAHLPAPAAYAAAVLSRLGRLPAPARDLVRAAAVLGTRAPARVATAMTGLADGTGAADAAVRARLLDFPPDRARDELAFTHPLVRAAVYEDLPPGHRRWLHLAAAGLLPAPASFAHRVAAAAGGFDGELATELIEAATASQATGAPRQAAQYLAWAAKVDSDPGRGEQSLFGAVRLLIWTGDVQAAFEHAEAVEARPPSPDRRYVQAILAVAQGWLEHAAAELRALAGDLSPEGQPALFGHTTAALAMAYASLGDDEAALEWAERARAVAGAVPDADALARQALAWSYAKTGRISQALGLLTDCSARKPEPSGFDAELLTVRGVVRNWAGDYPGAVADLRAVLRWHRAGVTIVGLTNAYAALAEAEFRRGDWDAAATHVEVAISLGRDLDHTWFLSYAHCVAAYLYAARGETETAADHAAAAQEAAGLAPSMEALACTALAYAHVAWARADWPGVIAALGPLERGDCGTASRYPNLVMWRYRLAEAWVNEGQVERARRLLAGSPQTPWGGVVRADRGRIEALAWVRDGRPDRAEAVFEAAGGLGGSGGAAAGAGAWRLGHGLLALDHGRFLLAERKRRAAGTALLSARAVLAGLGAAALTEACDQGLRACGVLVPAPAGDADGGPGLDALTAREQVVARLVASGMTNREAAAELFVSVKTIEYHLSVIFTKLHIRSRRELIAGHRAPAEAGVPTARAAGRPD